MHVNNQEKYKKKKKKVDTPVETQYRSNPNVLGQASSPHNTEQQVFTVPFLASCITPLFQEPCLPQIPLNKHCPLYAWLGATFIVHSTQTATTLF